MNESIDIYLPKINSKNVMNKVCSYDHRAAKLRECGNLCCVLAQFLRLAFQETYLDPKVALKHFLSRAVRRCTSKEKKTDLWCGRNHGTTCLSLRLQLSSRQLLSWADLSKMPQTGKAVPCQLTSNQPTSGCSVPHRRWDILARPFLWLGREPQAPSSCKLNVPTTEKAERATM